MSRSSRNVYMRPTQEQAEIAETTAFGIIPVKRPRRRLRAAKDDEFNNALIPKLASKRLGGGQEQRRYHQNGRQPAPRRLHGPPEHQSPRRDDFYQERQQGYPERYERDSGYQQHQERDLEYPWEDHRDHDYREIQKRGSWYSGHQQRDEGHQRRYEAQQQPRQRRPAAAEPGTKAVGSRRKNLPKFKPTQGITYEEEVPEEPEDADYTRKLFFYDLSAKIKPKHLKGYFSKFGLVEGLEFSFRQIGEDSEAEDAIEGDLGAGWGVITCSKEPKMMKRILEKEHVVKGYKFKVAPFLGQEQLLKFMEASKKGLVCVERLPNYFHEKMLSDVFRRFGDIEEAYCVFGRQADRRWKTGYVVYADKQALEKLPVEGVKYGKNRFFRWITVSSQLQSINSESNNSSEASKDLEKHNKFLKKTLALQAHILPELINSGVKPLPPKVLEQRVATPRSLMKAKLKKLKQKSLIMPPPFMPSYPDMMDPMGQGQLPFAAEGPIPPLGLARHHSLAQPLGMAAPQLFGQQPLDSGAELLGAPEYGLSKPVGLGGDVLLPILGGQAPGEVLDDEQVLEDENLKKRIERRKKGTPPPRRSRVDTEKYKKPMMQPASDLVGLEMQIRFLKDANVNVMPKEPDGAGNGAGVSKFKLKMAKKMEERKRKMQQKETENQQIRAKNDQNQPSRGAQLRQMRGMSMVAGRIHTNHSLQPARGGPKNLPPAFLRQILEANRAYHQQSEAPGQPLPQENSSNRNHILMGKGEKRRVYYELNNSQGPQQGLQDLGISHEVVKKMSAMELRRKKKEYLEWIRWSTVNPTRLYYHEMLEFYTTKEDNHEKSNVELKKSKKPNKSALIHMWRNGLVEGEKRSRHPQQKTAKARVSTDEAEKAFWGGYDARRQEGQQGLLKTPRDHENGFRGHGNGLRGAESGFKRNERNGDFIKKSGLQYDYKTAGSYNQLNGEHVDGRNSQNMPRSDKKKAYVAQPSFTITSEKKDFNVFANTKRSVSRRIQHNTLRKHNFKLPKRSKKAGNEQSRIGTHHAKMDSNQQAGQQNRGNQRQGNGNRGPRKPKRGNFVNRARAAAELKKPYC